MAHENRPAPLPTSTPAISGTYRRAPPGPPEAGIDYPRSSEELQALYPDEAACRAAVARLRWPRGFTCGQCGVRAEPARSGLLRKCASCGYLTAITCDTMFHGSATPLRLWFRALWEILGQPSGANPRQVQQRMELRQRHTAVEVVARVRRAMAAAIADPLQGHVEMGRSFVEAPLGPPPAGKSARGPIHYTPLVVAIAIERARQGAGRARLAILEEANETTIADFASTHVQLGSVVHTGTWQGYAGLDCAGFEHLALPAQAPGATPELPLAAWVGDELRRWLRLTPGISRPLLPAAVDEFAFRYQFRAAPRGLTFYHLLQQAVPTARVATPMALHGPTAAFG